MFNLTTDKAPTNPNDKAKEFLTITITTNTIEERITKFRAIDDLLNETFENVRKILLTSMKNAKDKVNYSKKEKFHHLEIEVLIGYLPLCQSRQNDLKSMF